MFANMGLAGLVVLLFNESINMATGKHATIHILPLALWIAINVFFGVEAITAVSRNPTITLCLPLIYANPQFLDIFVPLVGR